MCVVIRAAEGLAHCVDELFDVDPEQDGNVMREKEKVVVNNDNRSLKRFIVDIVIEELSFVVS